MIKVGGQTLSCHLRLDLGSWCGGLGWGVGIWWGGCHIQYWPTPALGRPPRHAYRRDKVGAVSPLVLNTAVPTCPLLQVRGGRPKTCMKDTWRHWERLDAVKYPPQTFLSSLAQDSPIIHLLEMVFIWARLENGITKYIMTSSPLFDFE